MDDADALMAPVPELGAKTFLECWRRFRTLPYDKSVATQLVMVTSPTLVCLPWSWYRPSMGVKGGSGMLRNSALFLSHLQTAITALAVMVIDHYWKINWKTI